MGFNPMKLGQLKPMWGRFKMSHPDFMAFVNKANSRGLQRGSVVSITLTTPSGEKMETELTLTAEDIQMVDTIKSIF
jgi:hypothetical protein